MYSIQQASELLGVSISTLRRWEEEKRLIPKRTHGGHRRYTAQDLLSINPHLQLAEERITIAYCRVSSNDQKQDLERQVERVSDFCIAKGYSFQVIRDIGSGLNYKKKGLLQLIEMIESNQVERVVVNYKDRLLRFGYELFQKICELHQVQIEIINHTEDKSYEEEMVEDILSIITVFSSRLYGSRSHKKKQIIEANQELFRE